MRTKEKGITLIALVITIILILLLAAITISALTGSGLFEQAKEAKRRQEIAEMKEKLNLAVMQTTLEKNANITIDDYINTLIQNGIIGEGDIEDIENGKIITTEGGLLFEVTTDERENIEIEYAGTTETMIPTISLNVIGSTTNTIKVSTSSRRNKEGTIEYYIKKENDNYSKAPSYKETNIENGKTYTYEFENLDQEQKYIIKAVAVAANGQKAEEEKEWTTGVIPELIAKDISFSYEPDNWTNGPVKVTADIVNEELETTGFTLRLTNDITTDVTTWPTATEGLTVSTNGEIYALLVDGRGQIGKSDATGNVDKIDTLKPTIETVIGSTTITNTGTIKATNIADTGGSGIAGYYVNTTGLLPEETESGWIELAEDNFTYNVNSNGTYYVWVKDAAGNISETKSCKVLVNYEQNGLIAHYDGINNTGNGHSSTAKVWKDISGNGNDITLYNFDSNENSGWIDDGILLDGVDDYMYRENPLYNGQGKTTDMTVEIISEKTSSQYGNLINFGSITNKRNIMDIWTTQVDDGTSRCYVVHFFGEVNKYSYSGTLIPQSKIYLNQLNSITYGLNKNNGFVYVDGGDTYQSKETISESNMPGWDENVFYLGRDYKASYIGENDERPILEGLNYYFGGKVKSVRIYNRALTEEEIKNNNIIDKQRYFK